MGGGASGWFEQFSAYRLDLSAMKIRRDEVGGYAEAGAGVT